MDQQVAHRGVGLGDRAIDRQCLIGGRQSHRNGLARRSVAVEGEHRVYHGLARVGERVVGVDRDRLIEQRQRPPQLRLAPATEELDASQVEVVGLRVFRRDPVDTRRLGREDRGLEGLCHPARDLGLKSQDALHRQIPVIHLGPKLTTGRGLAELEGEPHVLSYSRGAALHDPTGVELLADGLERRTPAARRVAHRRRA